MTKPKIDRATSVVPPRSGTCVAPVLWIAKVQESNTLFYKVVGWVLSIQIVPGRISRHTVQQSRAPFAPRCLSATYGL